MTGFNKLLSVAVLAAALAPAAAMARSGSVTDNSQPAQHLVTMSPAQTNNAGGRIAQNGNVPVALATAPGISYAAMSNDDGFTG